ncbi:hypothetical protein [Oryza sativa Japonica Group]|uniref:Uncharacterized protein n=1 Tax=Oryza sativa subsp. japonica TaxID=39947 RepID=Q5JKU6_ORYSJ|nr:hypothetical protein [Oryza sativa Japonica Group]
MVELDLNLENKVPDKQEIMVPSDRDANKLLSYYDDSPLSFAFLYGVADDSGEQQQSHKDIYIGGARKVAEAMAIQYVVVVGHGEAETIAQRSPCYADANGLEP